MRKRECSCGLGNEVVFNYVGIHKGNSEKKSQKFENGVIMIKYIYASQISSIFRNVGKVTQIFPILKKFNWQ